MEVAGPGQALAAVQARLGQFPDTGCAAAGLRFEYGLAGPGFPPVVRPKGASRIFYDPVTGQALYFAGSDELYLEYGDRVASVCSPATGLTRISSVSLSGTDLWYATHPFFTLPFIECLKRRGLFNIHAAAVGKNGRTILFAGTSGAGKSTLALALASRGFDLCGDDMQFLRRDGDGLKVLAFPEELDLTEETQALFPEMESMRGLQKAEGWPKQRMELTRLKTLRIAMETTPAALIFPQVSRKPVSHLTEMEPGKAFLQLASNVLLTEPVSSKAHFGVLAQLTESVPCYSLSTGTDFGEVAQLMQQVLS